MTEAIVISTWHCGHSSGSTRLRQGFGGAGFQHLAQQARPSLPSLGGFYMSRESGGSIVNISAPYASDGKPGVVHSACAKAGVDSMTRTLAAEWADYKIRVNAVSPGPFLSGGAADWLWPSDDIEQKLLADIPCTDSEASRKSQDSSATSRATRRVS